MAIMLGRRAKAIGGTFLLIAVIVLVLLFLASRDAMLEDAAEAGKYWKARALLFLGADPNGCIGPRYGGPLHRAVIGGHKNVAELLIAKGANLEADGTGSYKTIWGTPLECAAGSGNKEMVEFLIAEGADVNGAGEAMCAAIRGGHRDIVETLAVKGADLNVRYAGPYPVRALQISGSGGMTALHVAVCEGETQIASLLISRGADVNAKDEHGGTPLHWVVASLLKRERKLPSAELLLAKGCDVNAGDNKGRTPLDWASAKAGLSPLDGERMKDVIALLRKHGGRTGKKQPKPSSEAH